MGTARRRFFYGPGIDNFDLALEKTVPLTGSKALQFRAEAFNAFNHAQFYGAGGPSTATLTARSLVRSSAQQHRSFSSWRQGLCFDNWESMILKCQNYSVMDSLDCTSEFWPPGIRTPIC